MAGGCIAAAARPRVSTRPVALSVARLAPSRGVDVLPPSVVVHGPGRSTWS